MRRQLGAELTALRRISGLAQRELVVALSSSQAAVSRMERGEGVPTRPQVQAWLQVCAAPPDAVQRVLALVEAAHTETRSWADLVPVAGVPHLQGIAAAREQTAVLVRNCALTWLPGLVQTADYARLILGLTDPDGQRDTAAALIARLDRQRVLYEPGRRFEILMGEGALRWMPDATVAAAQRDRLVSLATLPTVELAVLPSDRTGVPAWHSFIHYEMADGSSTVTTELVHGGQEITDPLAVTAYADVWRGLWEASVSGAEAVELIRTSGS